MENDECRIYEPQLQDMGPMSMGAVAVSQKDPNVAWAAAANQQPAEFLLG